MHRLAFYALIIGLIVSLPLLAKPRQKAVNDSLQVLRFEVDSIPFSMQRVEGGVFVMGGTREQHREPISTDLPTHAVALDAYYIGHTEVTEALWYAVMPEWERMDDWHNPNHPITDISWFDCQLFIQRLDSITGLPFRLPTEAEWEFAARGGNDSPPFRFAGSFVADSVSWGLSNSGYRKHTVGLKDPNHLGLYDMTGNVSEWCYDWYAPYFLGTPSNYQGPVTGEKKIVRGSSFSNCIANSYLSRREMLAPDQSANYLGMRLALTLPNEPTLQVPTEEKELVKRIKIQNIRIKMQYVPGDNPYYISEEPINYRTWNKVLKQPIGDAWNQSVIGEAESEWQRFIETLRKQSHTAVDIATEQEVQQAIAQGITTRPQAKEGKKRHWEKSTRAIQQRRRHAKKAQKWADLIGVTIQTPDDPSLQAYDTRQQARWIVVRM